MFDPAPFASQLVDEAIRRAAQIVGVNESLTSYIASVGVGGRSATVGSYIQNKYGSNTYAKFLNAYETLMANGTRQINAYRVDGEILTATGWKNDLLNLGSSQIGYANLLPYDVGQKTYSSGDSVALHGSTLIALVSATGGNGTGFAKLLGTDATLFDAFVGQSEGNTGAPSNDRSDDATAAGTSAVTVSGSDPSILERALLKTASNQTGLFAYFQSVFGTLLTNGVVAAPKDEKDPNDLTLHTAFERLALDVFRDDVAGTSTVTEVIAKGILSAVGGSNGSTLGGAVVIHKSDITASAADELDPSTGLQFGETEVDKIVWNDLRSALGNDQLTEQVLGKRHDKIFGSAVTQSLAQGSGTTITTLAQGLPWNVAVAQAGSAGSFTFDPNDTSTGARSGDANQNLLIFGGAGTNTIKGGNKNDIIVTGDGTTTVQASNGNAIIVAGKGTTTVNAGNGTNTIIGGSGNLTLNALTNTGPASSTPATETLLGGSGNCTVNVDCSIKTGPSAVLLEGGTGTNIFNLTAVENQKHGPYGTASSFFVMWGGGGNTSYNVSYDVPANQAGYLALETVAISGLTRNNFFEIDTQKLISYLDAQGILTTQPTYGPDFNGIVLRSAGDSYNVGNGGPMLTVRSKDNVVDISQFLKSPSAIDPTLGNGGTNYFISSSSDVTLDFGLGNNTVWHGGDTFGETFTYASNDGNEVIDAFTSAGSSDVLNLTNLTAANVSLAITDGVNLTITDKTTGETIRVLNQYLDASGRYGLKTLVFSDGTSLDVSRSGVVSLARNAGSTYLYNAISSSNVSLKGGVYVEHSQGETKQTYVYHAGDGSSVISDFTAGGSTDVLSLADLNQAQVTFSKIANDLLVTATASGDVIRIENQFSGSGYGVSSIAFADGTALTAAQLSGKATNGTNPSSYVTTTSSNTTITMAAANQTFAHGPNVGGETYLYAKSNGNVSLDVQTSAGSTDVLKLTDCKLSDISAAIVDGYNLRITVNATGKTITVLNEFLGSTGQYGVGSVSLQDGTLSRSALLNAFPFVGTAGSTYLYDSLSGSTVQAGPGDQYITHSKGESHQTYAYARGDGNDVISTVTSAGSTDVLKMTNMNATDVILTKSGQDLLVQTISNGQVVRIKNEFTNNSYGIASINFANGRIYDRHAISSVSAGNTSKIFAPIIDGMVATQSTTDSNIVTPFANVTIADPNINGTETLSIFSTGGTGYLTDGPSFSGLKSTQIGSYTLTGTASQVTAELRALQFTPDGNQPNTTATTTFNLLDSSSVGTSTSDSTTTVLDKVSAAAPLIAGTVAGQATTHEAAVTPFAGVVVAEPNAGGSLTVSIQVSGNGSLSDAPQFSGLKATSTSGLYTLSGTDLALTAEMQALVFKPASSGTTRFTISVTSSAGTSTVDSTTTVVDQSGSGAVSPKISGTVASQATTFEAALKPFSGVTITDSNAGATETLTITVGGSGGTLADGSGFSGLKSGTAGVYTLSGSAAAVTTELNSIVFKPTAGAANTSSTSTFKLTDASSAGTSVTDTTTTVVNSDPTSAPIVIKDTNGTWATVNVTNGTISLINAQAAIHGGGNSIGTDANGDTFGLYDTGGSSDTVNGSNNLIYLNNAQSKVIGGNNTIVFDTSVNDAVVLSGTNGNWDVVNASHGAITLNNAQAAIHGGGNMIGTDLNGDTFGLYDTGGTYDTVNGSNNSIALNNAQAAIHGGGNSIGTDANGDTFSLYDTGGTSDTVNGSNNLISLNNAQSKVIGGNNTIVFDTSGNDAVLLSGTNNNWDVVNASHGTITLNGAQAAIHGSGNTIGTDSNGDVFGLYDTGTTYDTVNGSNNTIALNKAQSLVVGGNNVINFDTSGNDVVTISGTTGNWDTVNATNGIIRISNAQATVVGNNDSVYLDGGQANVQGNNNSIYGSSQNNITISGQGNILYENQGSTSVAISDLGHALTVAIGSSTQTETITGFGTTDTTGVIDFKNGAGGFSSVSNVLNALHSDGHGGTLLSLGSAGSIDFLSTPQSSLHASNFKIG